MLHSDHCVNTERLLALASSTQEASLASQIVYPAVMNKSPQAMALLSQLTLQTKDPYWLHIVADIGDAQTLHQLAIDASGEQQRLWLLRAAKLGHAPSQFELAMLMEDVQQMHDWMQKAARAGYLPAVISMGKYHFARNDFESAQFWLSQAADQDALSAYKLAWIHWQDKQAEQALSMFTRAANLGNQDASAFADILGQHSPNNIGAVVSAGYANQPACLQQVQLVATSLRSMRQALNFKHKFDNDQRLAQLPICVNAPVWLSQEALTCSGNFDNSARLGCDLSTIAEKQKIPNYSHLVVFAQQGKANVSNGVMYLDQADTYSVFVHELAHFSGFIDEYPLAHELARYHCEKNDAPNLVLLGDIHYQPLTRAQQWQSLLRSQLRVHAESNSQTRPRGMTIAASKSCKNINKPAFKPSGRMTFMEFHDVEYIPPTYIALWHQRLVRDANKNILADGFAIAAMRSGDEQSMLFWQQQAMHAAD